MLRQLTGHLSVCLAMSCVIMKYGTCRYNQLLFVYENVFSKKLCSSAASSGVYQCMLLVCRVTCQVCQSCYLPGVCAAWNARDAVQLVGCSDSSQQWHSGAVVELPVVSLWWLRLLALVVELLQTCLTHASATVYTPLSLCTVLTLDKNRQSKLTSPCVLN